MNSRKKMPHIVEQHVGEGDDFLKLTSNNRDVRKGTNSSSGQKSTQLTSLQSTLPRSLRGRPATKCPLVERGCSDETICTVEKNSSHKKADKAEKRYAANKYYLKVKSHLGDMLLLDDNSCHEEETPATGKTTSTEKHQKQLSGKRHRVSEKSRSFENHRSAENDISTQRGDLNQKRQLTEKGHSTVEGGLGDRGSYGERGRSIERRQPANKGLSTKKNMSPKKSYLDGRGPSMENHHQQENDRSAKKLSCTERSHQIEGDHSVKRGLSTEKDHPVGRGPPAKKSHIADKGYSASKSRSAGRGCPIKSRRARKVRSIDLVTWAWNRILAGEDSPTWRGPCIQISPIVEAHSVDRGKTAKERPSTANDHPTGRSRPEKKSRPAEEGCSVDRVNLSRSIPFAGEHIPTGRDRHIRSRPAEEGRLLERSYTVEKRTSTGKDHPTWRSRPQKRSSPAEEGQSADSGPSAWQNRPTGRGRLLKKSCSASKHLPEKRSCSLEKGHLAEKGLSSKRIYSAGKDHSGERGHPSKKKRQLSSKKGSTEKKFCSGESIAFHDSYTDEDSNTGENACYVEEGHHSMVQGIRVETLSSGSMPTVPVQEHVKNTPKEESNTGENASSVEKGHHSMEQDIRIEKHSSGSIRTVPVPEHMNTPVNRIGSATSQVAQVSHQNVAGAVTTGQHMQAANLIMGVELKWPQVLKACLVEDWDLVNNQKQLFQLPAEKNVDHILANYVTFVKSQGKSDNTVYSIVELLYTTREYFNKILGTQLLSQFEKPQYAEMLLAYPDIPISRIYGAPHLLRLLVNIGAELAHWSLSRQSLMSVSSYMHSFLNFLAENSTSLFSSSNYKMASPEYCFKAL